MSKILKNIKIILDNIKYNTLLWCMNLKEYVDALKEVLEQNPEYSKLSVVTASDEEGNSYNEVYYLPTLGNFSISNGFVPEDNYEDLDEDERITNSVCLN